jgi:hypothetical protein
LDRPQENSKRLDGMLLKKLGQAPDERVLKKLGQAPDERVRENEGVLDWIRGERAGSVDDELDAVF